MLGRQDSSIQTRRAQPTAHMVSPAATLHGHHAARLQRLAPFKEPIGRHGPGQCYLLKAIDSMYLVNPLGQIHADAASQISVNLAHGTSPFRWAFRLIDSHHQSWRIDAVARRWEVLSYSLEWTSTSWPRYARQLIIASRGQLVPATQLQR
ncbi:MAG: hypothetical protein C4K60_06490 [Ideonella sp. MAG2]|nr:MAG: hypothetical protein C4K60_06490 [Ideonella sp. MAG2]